MIECILRQVTPCEKFLLTIRNRILSILQDCNRFFLHPFHEGNQKRIFLIILTVSRKLDINQLLRLGSVKKNPSHFLAGKTECLLLHLPIDKRKARILCAHFTQRLLAQSGI